MSELAVDEFIIDYRIVILSLNGALSSATCATFRDALARAVAVRHPAQIIVDATRLASTDSAGLSALAESAEHVRGTGGRMIVVGTGPHRPSLTGLPDTVATVGAALSELRGRGGSSDQP
ncbi:hypothetical protein Acor_84010 [Acrocarpospora corrugata]|uniref:STAS domain-containing protein n=1 Tax=Acrocarpospora corrugata TaxID=35763 RepID=A0A5M3WE26_9ACTN|nr:STAS domain-containing protein [Acrocarpospora corrugata]GES06332.1 hypothetical protein Acor_84010 [Acrocarpospora corrugata]